MAANDDVGAPQSTLGSVLGEGRTNASLGTAGKVPSLRPAASRKAVALFGIRAVEPQGNPTPWSFTTPYPEEGMVVLRRVRCSQCMKKVYPSQLESPDRCQCKHPAPEVFEVKTLAPLKVQPSTEMKEVAACAL